MALQVHPFTITMIGDDVTLGKSSILMLVTTGKLKSKRVDTPEVEEHRLVFDTSLERLVEFSCLDTGYQRIHRNPQDCVFDGAHGVIVMLDQGSRISWLKAIGYEGCRMLSARVSGNRIVLCGVHDHIPPRLESHSIKLQIKKGKKYFDMTPRTNLKIERAETNTSVIEEEVSLSRFTKVHEEVLNREKNGRLSVMRLADGRLWFVGHNVSSSLCHLMTVFVPISPPCIYECFNRICHRHIAYEKGYTFIVHLEDFSSCEVYQKIARDFPLYFNIFDAKDFFNVVSTPHIGGDEHENDDDGMYQTRQWPMSPNVTVRRPRKSRATFLTR